MGKVLSMLTRRVIEQDIVMLHSDNFDGTLMLRSVYEQLRLDMSTGDYHTHVVTDVDGQTATEFMELGRKLITNYESVS